MKLIDRAKNILLQPKTEWVVIQSEEEKGTATLINYGLPLIVIGSAATFLGLAIFGYSVPFLGHFRSVGWAFNQALVNLLVAVLGVIISAYVIDMLAPNFKSEKNIDRSMRLVIFSMTPSWICAVLNIIPALGFLGFLGGIYGLILLYQGLAGMKNTPEDQRASYFVVSLLVIIIVYVAIAFIIGMIMTAFIPNPASMGPKEAADAMKEMMKNMGK